MGSTETLSASMLVSIVTPVLNGGKYVAACLDSVVGQSYQSVEHVFIDGGSTDETTEIIQRYIRQYPGKVRMVSAPGTDPGQAWNIGVKSARGQILGCIGVDDLCEPGAIETVVEFFRSNPDAHFVHGHCTFINEKGEIIKEHRVGDFKFQEFVNTAKHIATPSAFCKRAALERIGWLDSSGDDFDVWIRIAREYSIYRVDRVLSQLMIHADSAFNPSDFEKRKTLYEQTFQISRRYGGQVLSPLAMRYYVAVVLGWLRLGSYLPVLRAIFRRIRGYGEF
jgi:glycosyltransferase involved in cell wall biosynthesis